MRKTSIVSILAAALSAFCGLGPEAHAQPRVRYNIKDLSVTEQQRFVDAMFALRNPANFVPAGGWPADTNFPQNRYEQYVRGHDANYRFIHTGHPVGPGPNTPPLTPSTTGGNPWFLPWHRQLLFQMENDVRSLGGQFADFTLPYWDGTRDKYPKDKTNLDGTVNLANGLLGGNGDPGNGNFVITGPFANPGDIDCPCKWQDYTPTGNGVTITGASRDPLRRSLGADADNDGRFDDLVANGPAKLADLLTKPNYSDLQCGDNQSGLEAAPGLHDFHHGVVGGQLGNPTSGSTDPTFWLLHAFTDLQWARWESIHGTIYDDMGEANHGVNDPMTGVGTTGIWGLTELNGDDIYDNNPVPLAPGFVTPADVLNYWTMPGGGYTYDYRPNPSTEDRVRLGAPVPEPATLGLLLLGVAGVLPRRNFR